MKIRAQYGLETYLSEGGYLVICQDVDGEDQRILLSPHECKLLADELRKFAKNIGWWADAVSEPELID